LRNSKIWILEPDVIYPCDWDKHTDLVDKRAWIEKYSHEEIIERCPDSYAITFWSHNW
jgi:hypothetical protein